MRSPSSRGRRRAACHNAVRSGGELPDDLHQLLVAPLRIRLQPHSDHGLDAGPSPARRSRGRMRACRRCRGRPRGGLAHPPILPAQGRHRSSPGPANAAARLVPSTCRRRAGCFDRGGDRRRIPRSPWAACAGGLSTRPSKAAPSPKDARGREQEEKESPLKSEFILRLRSARPGIPSRGHCRRSGQDPGPAAGERGQRPPPSSCGRKPPDDPRTTGGHAGWRSG